MTRAVRLNEARLALLKARRQREGVLAADQAETSIPRRPHNDEMPLSFGQERLWLVYQLAPASAVYNVPFCLRLRGPLDRVVLAHSLLEIEHRHASLRTTFPTVEGRPVQRVALPVGFYLPGVDLSGLPPDIARRVARRLRLAAAGRPFDLGRGPLYRVSLLKLADDHHLLLLILHHAVCDGASLEIYLRELGELYVSLSARRAASLPPPRVEYSDFAAWQRQRLSGECLEAEAAFWSDRLAGLPAILPLPADRPRPVLASFRGGTHRERLSPEVSTALRELAREREATVFMAVLAAFAECLRRYTGRDAFLVGTPISNRSHRDLEGVFGFFVNLLVLALDVSGCRTFLDLLQRVRATALDVYAHSELPFELLVERLRRRETAAHPFLRACFASHRALAARRLAPSLELSVEEIETDTAKFDLMVTCEEWPDRLELVFAYSTDIFDRTTMARWVRHLAGLIAAVAAEPTSGLGELELLTTDERHQLICERNDSALPVVATTGVHDLLGAQARAIPDAVAAIGDGMLTYRQVNRWASRLARRLRALGVGPESIVAVYLPRSAALPAALFGVLRAGAAYLPLDPAYPEARLRFMLSDSRAAALVSERPWLDQLASQEIPRLAMEEVGKGTDDELEEVAAGAASTSANLAYVIYTSGSTGQPKGVQVTQGNLLNFFAGIDSLLAASGPAGSWLATTSICFDISVLELLWTLCRGRTVIVAQASSGSPGATLDDPAPLTEKAELAAELLARQGATHLQCTPSFAEMLVSETPTANALGQLNEWLVGGEALPPGLVRRMRRTFRGRLFNMYGPTETTVWSAVESLTEVDAIVPLGRPIANTTIYLLDRDLRPVPMGVPGEIFIGGEGVTRGYRGRPDLTAERYLPDRFSGVAGTRLYRTGDLARARADGRLEFLGRADDQVKVRGHRIELGEIEAVLATHPAVRRAAVVALPNTFGDGRLIAFVMLAHEAARSPVEEAREEREPAAALRTFLAERLPAPMVPAAFVVVAALPFTSNGKIDRRTLKDLWSQRKMEGVGEASDGAKTIAPRNEREKALAKIFAEALGITTIGVGDNFFELGGNSLLGVRVMVEIRARFGRDLPLGTLLKSPTVAGLAALLSEGEIPSSYFPLVALQPAGTKRPFFCIHPAGGQVLRYVPLARLMGTERPFYALQARGLTTDEQPFATVEEMARVYLRAVRERHPEGPYLLGGYSLGGLIAYEMARQLESAGASVALVAMIDIGADEGAAMVEWDELRVLEFWAELFAIPISREELQALPPDRRVGHAVDVAKRAGRLPAQFTEVDANRYIKVHRTTMGATRTYRPGPYGGAVAVLKGDDDGNEALGWERLARRVEVHRVSGSHQTILSSEHLETLAKRLKACLNAADALA